MTGDVFDLLRENAWKLPTADQMANLHVTDLGEGAAHCDAAHHSYLVDAVRGNLSDARFVLFDQRGSLFSAVPDEAIERLTVDQLVDDPEPFGLPSVRIA